MDSNNNYAITELDDLSTEAKVEFLITKCKKIEEALRESETRYRALVATAEAISTERQRLYDVLETLHVNICLLDANFRILFANRAFREIFGESQGRPCYDYVYGLDQPCDCCQAIKVLETGQPQHWFFDEPDGSVLEVHCYPFTDVDGTSLVLEMNFDITERKQNEENLRQSEERFAQIFYNSPAAMAIVRMRDDRYIDINQKYLELTEFSREEVIGSTPLQLNIIVEGKKYREFLLSELRQKGEVKNFEYRIKTRAGNIVTILSSIILTNLDNELCRIALMKDITREREMEAEMARLERLNLIGEMAASIGHEIRNPMTSVRGFLQLLGEKSEYKGDSAYFDLMIEELDRANAIITEYLSMAKDKKVDLRPRSLNMIIKTIWPVIQSEANLKEINVEFEFSDIPESLIDESEIRQLILNMAHNGIEAMSPGGKLTIGTSSEGDAIVLYIKDEGHGLHPEIMDKIGTPFQTTKDNGTGLGLAVCYSIAARHSAKIDYDTGSTGTTFFVRFPQADNDCSRDMPEKKW